MKKQFFRIITLTMACFTFQDTEAQPPILFTPGGVVGSTSGGVTGVGVFTASPLSGYFDVNGDVRLNGSGSGDGVFFASPGGVKGLGILRSGFLNRADIRFDGNNMYLVAGLSSSAPPVTNGLTVTYNGNVGVGTASPLSASRMHIEGSSTFTTGASVDMSLGLGFPYDVKGFVANVVGNDDNTAFEGVADGSGGRYGVGGTFTGRNGSDNNFGVRGFADGGTLTFGGDFDATGGSYSNFGISSTASGGAICRAGDFEATGGGDNNGIYAKSIGGNQGIGGRLIGQQGPDVYGVRGEGHGSSNPGDIAHGAYFTALAAQQTYGVEVDAINNYAAATENYGVKSSATGDAATNYGVYAYAQGASGPGANTCYGIYAEVVQGQSAPVPPGAANGIGSYAGYFKGDVANPMGGGNVNAAFFNGVAVTSAPGMYAISDRKFKENIAEVENGLETIMQLSPKTYTFLSKDKFPSFSFAQGKQYGFIAQELEEVIPEMVYEAVNPAQYDHDGKKIDDAVSFKSVNYTALVPVLVSAIQEQQQMINELQKQLELYRSEQTTGTGVSVATEGVLLHQNAPNPFTASTEIKYYLPERVQKANILIFDLNGKQLKNYTIDQRGEGSVNLQAGTLAPGMYLYSLTVDGAIADTKRMILQGN